MFMYFGLLRVSEVSFGAHPIRARDVYLASNRDKLMFVLYTSKTHGYGSRPQRIEIEGVAKIGDFCAYSMGRKYLKLRGNYSDPNEQLFIFPDGAPVKSTHIRTTLKNIIAEIGLQRDFYNTHSFRTGRASDLLKSGRTVETIKYLGRWRSNAVYKYLK